MGLLVASSAYAFEDYRNYGLSADDYVSQTKIPQSEFTYYYNRAKADLWGDACDHGWMESKCSNRLAEDWRLQHAAAYIVADLIVNHDKDFKKSIYYVQLLCQYEPKGYKNGYWYRTDEPWNIDNPDDLIKEYLNPTSRDFYKRKDIYARADIYARDQAGIGSW